MGQVLEDCGRKSNFNYPVLGGGLFDIEKQQHLLSLKTDFMKEAAWELFCVGEHKLENSRST